MKNKILKIFGAIALITVFSLNLSHALNDYGVKDNSLHLNVIEQTSSLYDCTNLDDDGNGVSYYCGPCFVESHCGGYESGTSCFGDYYCISAVNGVECDGVATMCANNNDPKFWQTPNKYE